MNMSVVGLAALAAVVAVVAGWATRKAWGSANLAGKWLGAVVGVLVTLVAALAAIVLTMGLYRLRNQNGHPVREIEVEASAAALDRGEHLAKACAGCHSDTRKPPLSGDGEHNFLEGLGVVHPPNLTPGGVLKDRSPGRIARAIREGIGVDGRPLIVMPSHFFHSMSDKDVAAIIAYLRTEPDIDDVVPARELGPMGTILIGAGMFPLAVQDPIDEDIDPPDTDDEEEWGEYTATIMACAECHGAKFEGISEEDGPQGPALTVFADDWTDEQWRDTMRDGVDPTGNELDPDEMPWEEYSAALSDDELDAIKTYIATFAGKDEDDE